MNDKVLKLIADLTNRDGMSLVERALKTSEEMGELSEAVLSFANVGSCGYKNKTVADVVEESMDVAMCALSVAMHVGATSEDMERVLLEKLKKWQIKMVEVLPS